MRQSGVDRSVRSIPPHIGRTRFVRAKSLTPAVLLMAACGSAPTTGNAQNAQATPAADAAAASMPFKMERAGAFDNAFSIAFLPDGSLLVTEKPGHLIWWHGGSRTEIGGVPPVQQITQGGLLDVALAPDF